MRWAGLVEARADGVCNVFEGSGGGVEGFETVLVRGGW